MHIHANALYSTPDGNATFQIESGGYYYIKLDGTQQQIGSPRETGQYLKVDDVWDPNVNSMHRGRQIQAELAKTEYSQWGNTDDYLIVDPDTGVAKKVITQNFPLIDFHLNDMVVSFKTVNTNGVSWHTDIKAHIDDLATRKITTKGNNVILSHNRTLDLRVQLGGLAATEYLQAYAASQNIKMVVKEYCK